MRPLRKISTLQSRRITGQQLWLLIALLVLVAGLVAAVIFWYVPNRSDVIVKRALAESLKQSSVTFRLQMSGSTGMRVDGKIGQGGDFQVDITRIGQTGGDFSIRGVGGSIYLRQKEQWLTVPSQTLDALLPTSLGLTSKDTSASGVNEADRRRLEALYSRYGFVEVGKILVDETIEGKLCRHYQVRVNGQQLERFMKAAKREIPNLHIQDSQVRSIVQTSLWDKPADIWIAKDDGLIRRIAYRGSETAAGANSISLTILSYGEPVHVTKPEASRSLLDTMQP